MVPGYPSIKGLEKAHVVSAYTEIIKHTFRVRLQDRVASKNA